MVTGNARDPIERVSKRFPDVGYIALARLSIVDVGRRGEGQKAASARKFPKSLLDVPRWRAEYEPSKGNFLNFHPAPLAVPIDADAEQASKNFDE